MPSNRFKSNRSLKFFLKNTSLHGMKYIGDENKHWFERSFWFLLLLIFAVFSFNTLKARWILWKESPMIISTVNVPYYISSLPVPAITYCGDYLISSEEFNNFNLTEEEQIFICLVSHPESYTPSCKNIYLNAARHSLKIDDETFFKMFKELLFFNKKYLRDKLNSFMLGQRFDEPITCFYMPTHEGLCITCNALPLSQIYKNNTILHYFNNNPDDYEVVGEVHGFPILNSTRFNGLYPSLLKRPMNGVTLNDIWNLENDKVRIKQRLNRWYTIHSPWDVPNPFMRWHYSKDFRNRELQVFIEPDQTLIDDNFEISSTGRQCYFAYEKELEFFKYYTHHNCKLECLTREVINECGCVAFFMPHNDSTNICLTDPKCPFLIFAEMEARRLLVCDCPSSCNHTDYKFVSHDTIPDSIYSKLITVFIDDLFYPQIRRQSGTISNFIETSVTYLDMFLGLSLVTIVEILYYSILMMLEYFNIELVSVEDS